jgi:hypothetical protein
MKMKQLSIFLENRPGRLGALCGIIAEAGINLTTLSLADSGDFGLLRLITPEPEKAVTAIEAAGYAVAVTEVIALQVPDRPGGLVSILSVLEPHGIGIEYMYAFATRSGGDAVMVLRFSDMERAIPFLQMAGFNVLSAVELLG